jgi:hypothetical protein
MNSHATLKILILSASALSPLISTKIAHVLSQITVQGYAQLLGGRPLPAITQGLLLNFAGSNVSIGIGLALSVAIVIAVVSLANPKQRLTESASAFQVFLAFIGPFLSMLYLGSVLVAAVLPFVSQPAKL